MTDVPALPPGYRLVALDSVGSTNDEAARLAADGAPDGTVVWALEQRRGRGRRGRAWTGPRGNLMCSVLWRPRVPPAAAAQLSFVAALAVAEAAGAWLPAALAPRLKWPNDVLVGGRKIAGILLEAGLGPDQLVGHLTLGIGLNLRHHPEGLDPPATSIAAAGGDPPEPGAALAALCAALARWRARWNSGGFGDVREAWLARAHGLGEPITVRLERETTEGRFGGIDAAGELVLLLPSGLQRRIAAGDVFPARS